jgi:4-amino-4-deoxy-L-arabinose transferase-like glycosyltransferase
MKRLPRVVWAIAVAKAALILATTHLGFHRDEFYFFEASKHLSPSYVDFQPVTPLLVRLERFVFGNSIYGMRLIPALAGAAAVILAALIAREFGASERGQTYAAFALAAIPLFLLMTTTLNTVVLETPAWMLVALVFTRLVRTDDPKLWPWLGLAIGLSLLVKFTELSYVFGLGVAVLASPLRRHLRTPWPWIGAAVAFVVLGPSIVWQATHHWAVVEFVRHQGTGGAVLGLRGRAGFLASLVILPGPVALWLFVPGVRKLFADKTLRTVGLAVVVALAVLLVASGKGYYAAPGLAILAVAGAVAVSSRDGSLRALTIALVINFLVPMPLYYSPLSWLRSSKDLAQGGESSEHIGWPELAHDVSRVYERLRPDEQRRTIAIGTSYTIPAVLDFFSSRFPEPPSGSGHNSAYLWPPKATRDHVAIMIGFDRSEVLKLYRSAAFAGRFRDADRVQGYDWNDPIYVARGPRYTFELEWRKLKCFQA